MNFEQNIEKNRLKIEELPERKIGEKKSKIGSSLISSQCSNFTAAVISTNDLVGKLV